MMEKISSSYSRKRSVIQIGPGELIGSNELFQKGITSHHVSRLVHDDWLVPLGRGMYARQGKEVGFETAMEYLTRSFPDLHIGSMTAAKWHNRVHYLHEDVPAAIWGTSFPRLPKWFAERFHCSYHASRLFSPDMPRYLGLEPLSATHSGLYVSSPERALLEMISDIGKRFTIEEVAEVARNIKSIRSALLNELLAHTVQIKVLRILFRLARESVARRAS